MIPDSPDTARSRFVNPVVPSCEQQAVDHGRQHTRHPRLDVDDRMGQARVAAVERLDLGAGRRDLEERSRERGRGGDDIDRVALGQAGAATGWPR